MYTPNHFRLNTKYRYLLAELNSVIERNANLNRVIDVRYRYLKARVDTQAGFTLKWLASMDVALSGYIDEIMLIKRLKKVIEEELCRVKLERKNLQRSQNKARLDLELSK